MDQTNGSDMPTRPYPQDSLLSKGIVYQDVSLSDAVTRLAGFQFKDMYIFVIIYFVLNEIM